jgi:formylglycine-generating enzyme required for sulfatase activity
LSFARFRRLLSFLAAPLLFTGDACALDSLIVRLPGGIPLTMLLVPPGGFMMGSNDPDTSKWHSCGTSIPCESPAHRVDIGSSFYLGKYEVTQRQWRAVTGSNPSFFKSHPDCPVEQVSWNDCRAFCDKLSALNLGKFRLPSEAEWEYACRAGTTTRFFFGEPQCSPEASSCPELDSYALWGGNSKGGTVPVGGFKPNKWGFYDFYGNVYEWCEDDWLPNYHGAPADGRPLIGRKAEPKCLRGAWRGYDQVQKFTSFFRANHESTTRHGCCGVRLVRER